MLHGKRSPLDGGRNPGRELPRGAGDNGPTALAVRALTVRALTVRQFAATGQESAVAIMT
ncbi:hypothetical protein [Kitasatospora sp. NPDC088783]|uniref:hypothetical protein n=1 Tax=Kitasatospora sp. NPDC088783 TaxID=3364077 RepID=UPI003826ED19